MFLFTLTGVAWLSALVSVMIFFSDAVILSLSPPPLFLMAGIYEMVTLEATRK